VKRVTWEVWCEDKDEDRDWFWGAYLADEARKRAEAAVKALGDGAFLVRVERKRVRGRK
jgi:hypothetical protein